jgi:DNA-binding CsgD family transcriptional regulator
MKGASTDTPQQAGVPVAKGQKSRLADAERGLAVVLDLLRTLRAWDGFERGSERLLREVSGTLGHEAACLWLPQEDALIARAIWSAPSIEHRALESALRPLRFPPGVGLPGRAWLDRELIQPTTSIAGDRSPQCYVVLDGLCGSVALPALAGGEVLGVLELYSTAPVELSERLRLVLSAVGDELGSFFARRRGELGLSPLTTRELEVLTLAAEGLTGRKIGERLAITVATVKTHFEHIYTKLEVSDRTAAVAYALRGGLIE